VNEHISPEEAVRRLQSLSPAGDTELQHVMADAILCGVLRFLGHDEVADAFEVAKDEVVFWYA